MSAELNLDALTDTVTSVETGVVSKNDQVCVDSSTVGNQNAVESVDNIVGQREC